ncbi:hypothetical protein [Sciscionella marina]|uniref:hypothetical protein n=1 Tax=Sciscionella marina TaxID=508770 RepID=UPI00035F43D9|nr:hypothetical protein [Sciscionella marina]
MTNKKKAKKWGLRSRHYAERAEAAADRSEAAVARIVELSEHTGAVADEHDHRPPVYTAARETDSVPAAAEVPSAGGPDQERNSYG